MKKTVSFIGITFFLILTTAFCVAGTVQSQSSHDIQRQESFYRELEDMYVEEIRAYLAAEGYANSGIMLTRTVCEDGRREYRLTVHNGRFARLTGEETKALAATLEEKAFLEEDCSFQCLVKGNE